MHQAFSQFQDANQRATEKCDALLALENANNASNQRNAAKFMMVAAHGWNPASKHAEMVERYNRSHNLSALHTVTKDTLDTFIARDGAAFSKFKYGDPDSIEYFAKGIAAQIWATHGTRLVTDPESFCILAPAYRKAPTSAVALSLQVAEVLSRDYGVTVESTHLSRNVLGSGDYGLLTTKKERESQIFGHFHYEGRPLTGRTVLFVEDALVSGAHYLETQRVLSEQAGLDLCNLHGYFIADVHAETFTKEQYSVENLLNHLWIDRDLVHRLTEILQKPDSVITPRVLKLLLSEPWLQVRSVLEEQQLHQVLSITHLATAEGLDQNTKYAENGAHLVEYARERLTRSKDAMGLGYAFKVDDSTIHSFLKDPVVDHEVFGPGRSLGEMYSLLKFGDRQALDYFAYILADSIRNQHFHGGAPSSEWGIAIPTYASGKGSAALLGERVAELLNIPVTWAIRQDITTTSYGGIGDATVRRNEVGASSFTLKGPIPKKAIVFDDSVVSCASMEMHLAVAGREIPECHAYTLVNVDSVNLALEEALNTSVIGENNLDSMALLLQNQDTILTIRMVKVMLKLPEEKLQILSLSLPANRLIEVLNVARKGELDQRDGFRNGFSVLQEITNERIRSRKGGEIAPYESIYILDTKDRAGIFKDFSEQFSLLKHGHVGATNLLSQELCRIIRARLGEDIDTNPENWVVAATHYFRVPNAASNLGEAVAHSLGLPYIDMRAREIYEGEFGAISDREERLQQVSGNAFLTKPHEVNGKKVIFIDDVIVSGAHLQEHVNVLHNAGALRVKSFSLLDLSNPQLSVEHTLNNCGVEDSDLRTIIEILQDPEAPLLTRTLKRLLKLDTGGFLNVLAQLPSARVFDMCEKAFLEGYSSLPSMSQNYLFLEKDAQRRHIAVKPALQDAIGTNFKMMLFDYDQTLAPSLTVLKPDMIVELTHLLKRGVHIGIQSLQPIIDRGLIDHVLVPLRDYLASEREDLSILRRLHLIPSEGTSAFRPDNNGTIDMSRPEYDIGFSPEKWEELCTRSLEGGIEARASKILRRGAYLSLHFRTLEDLQTSQKELEVRLADFLPQVRIAHKKTADESKHVLHIKAESASKAIGREYMLRTVAAEIERETGEKVARGEIVVAGDRMGPDPRDDDDSHMFVHGGVNLALGPTVRTGCFTEFQDMNEVGTLKFLRALRSH